MVKKIFQKKGQIVTLDFILSLFIFFFLLIAYYSWYANFSTIDLDMHDQSFIKNNVQSSHIALVKTPGVNQSWNESEGFYFGLEDEKGFLSLQKITLMRTINDTDYDRYRDLLGLADDIFFHIEVNVFNGTHFVLDPSLSSGIKNATRSVYSVESFGTLDNKTPVKLVSVYGYG
jgi:hypothetical protein